MKPYAPRTSAVHDPVRHAPRPVVGLDVDGTLGDYHDWFVEFARLYFGKEIPYGYDGSVSFAKWMGVSKANYRRAKLAFRRSGLKRAMPVYKGARELTCALRSRGALVVICTSRPFLAMEVVDEDTRVWLRRNGIQYDQLLHGERKYRDLKAIYGENRIVAVMDDLEEYLVQAAVLGLPTVLRRGAHNRDVDWRTSADDLGQAQATMLELLGQWEKEYR